MRPYLVVWKQFRGCHEEPINTLMHMILTPGALSGLLGLLTVVAGRFCVIVLMIAYIAHLNVVLGRKRMWGLKLWAATVITIFSSWYCSINRSLWWSIVVLFACNAVQNLSQYKTDEQGIDNGGWKYLMLVLPGYWIHEMTVWEYYYYLLPFVLHCTWLDWDLTILVPQGRIVKGKLLDQKENANHVSRWSREQEQTEDGSFSFNWQEIPMAVKERIRSIVTCREVDEMFGLVFSPTRWDVLPVWGMNKIGVGPSEVYLTGRVNAPFFWMPFASLYRLVCSLTVDTKFIMVFPEMEQKRREICVEWLDIVGFDYSREIQGWKHDSFNLNKDFSITLQLYYVIYPKFFLTYGIFVAYSNLIYEKVTRAILNKFHVPRSPTRWLEDGNRLIVFITLVQKKVGWENLVQVSAFWILSWFLGNYRIRLYSTCFLHYLIYMTTWYYRNTVNVCWSRFLRNAVFYKGIFILQLAHLCTPLWRQLINPFRMIFLVFGLGMSLLAFAVLGVKRTFFGYELGCCQALRISSFPYNCIYHPMYFGQLLVFLAISSLDLFREDLRLFIWLHVVLTTTHLVQEVFDIHKK